MSGSAPLAGGLREVMRVSLSVLEGPDKGATFLLTKARHTLGRADADILLQDPEVSKLHAAIASFGDDFSLTDLKSTNGTYLNGKRVEEAPVAHLDQIQMGRTKLLFTILEATEWAEATPHETKEPAKKRVLLAESSPLRQALAEQMGKANLEVISARNGREAKALFGHLRPLLDLLVLDLHLERVEGTDFLAWLNEQRLEGRPPILALTHVHTVGEILRCLEGLDIIAALPKASPPVEIACCAAQLVHPGGGAPRVPLARAQLDVLYESRGETLRGIIADLGRTGMVIQAPRPCQQGAEVQLIFALPEVPRLFRARGRVRAVQHERKAAQLDVEFLDLDLHAKTQIAAFAMARRLKFPGPPQAAELAGERPGGPGHGIERVRDGS